jgi:hypothetical protein
MGQIHKRFTNEQIRLLFGAYVHGHIKGIDVQEGSGNWEEPFLRAVPGVPAGTRDPVRLMRQVKTRTVYIGGQSLGALARLPGTPGNEPLKWDSVMSVVWPQKTVRGLGSPGSTVTADPHTESGQRRARV